MDKVFSQHKNVTLFDLKAFHIWHLVIINSIKIKDKLNKCNGTNKSQFFSHMPYILETLSMDDVIMCQLF